MASLSITRTNFEDARRELYERGDSLQSINVLFTNGCSDTIIQYIAANCTQLQNLSLHMRWITRVTRDIALAAMARRLKTLKMIDGTVEDFMACCNPSIDYLWSVNRFALSRANGHPTLWVNLTFMSINDAIQLMYAANCVSFLATFHPAESFIVPHGFMIADIHNATSMRIAMMPTSSYCTAVYIGHTQIMYMPAGPIAVYMISVNETTIGLLSGYENCIVSLTIAMPLLSRYHTIFTMFLSKCTMLRQDSICICGSTPSPVTTSTPSVSVGRHPLW